MRAALGASERGLQRSVDARMTVTEVPAAPPSMVTEPTGSAVPGSTVPRRETGITAAARKPDCRRILSVLESEAGRVGMRYRQLAVALGLEAVPAKAEGLRSKAKRLVERERALQHSRYGRERSPRSRWRPSEPGRSAFLSVGVRPATAHEHGHRPQRHGLFLSPRPRRGLDRAPRSQATAARQGLAGSRTGLVPARGGFPFRCAGAPPGQGPGLAENHVRPVRSRNATGAGTASPGWPVRHRHGPYDPDAEDVRLRRVSGAERGSPHDRAARSGVAVAYRVHAYGAHPRPRPA